MQSFKKLAPELLIINMLLKHLYDLLLETVHHVVTQYGWSRNHTKNVLKGTFWKMFCICIRGVLNLLDTTYQTRLGAIRCLLITNCSKSLSVPKLGLVD